MKNYPALDPRNALTSEEAKLTDLVLERFYSPDPELYHNQRHILQMLALKKRFFEKFLREEKILSVQKTIFLDNSLFLAIIFHDCIYFPGSSENEKNSAEEMRNFLSEVGNSYPEEVLVEAEKLILSTEFGKTPSTPEEKFLHDLDWSGFCTLEELEKNEEKIIEEAVRAGWLRLEAQTARLEFYMKLADSGKQIFYSVLSPFEKTAQDNLSSRILNFSSSTLSKFI